jgi:cytochrome c oxidase assembly protein subunit 15
MVGTRTLPTLQNIAEVLLNTKLIWLSRLTLITAILAWLVIGLGAYTRLTDAGLGCPDWPGCYGHFSVPTTATNISSADQAYPQTPVVAAKAWAEMIHRYFAGTLGLLIIITAALATLVANRFGFQFLILGMLLFALLVYQAVLGMWTVTLKLLPIIVTQHLLGGMTIIALVWLLHLKSRQALYVFVKKEKLLYLKPWTLIGLILVCLQIGLGAWTSTNYAAVSCSHFPFCQSQPWHYDFHTAFSIFASLNDIARMTIQMTHRLGALIVTIYLLFLTGWIHYKMKSFHLLKKVMTITFSVLIIQLCLGISNVLFSLPLAIAIAHNLCAAILLVCMITLNFVVFSKPATVITFAKEAII